MLLNLNIIGIVVHEAGPANIIVEWVKKFKKKVFLINVTGPAKKIFNTNKINFKLNQSFKTIIGRSDFIISGSSAKSVGDHKIRILAIKNNVKIASLLDHWVNFKEGFLYRNRMILPDQIWVTDNIAYKMAKKIFKKKKVLIKKNLYEENLLKKIKISKKTKKRNILYLLEPFKSNTQQKAIKFFFLNINKCKNINIIFRPHPSENKNKYKKLINKYNKFDSYIDNSSKLEDLISWSNVVVGCQTYAMVLALKARRKVFTMLPIDNYKCSLPFKKIKTLKINSLI